ncbi:putative transmembrane protein, partial [Gregarina niphandrodes]
TTESTFASSTSADTKTTESTFMSSTSPDTKTTESTSSSTSSGFLPVPVPVPGTDGKWGPASIAGATAGVVAGVAVVGGFLWSAAPWRRTSADAGLNQQVEVPETLEERETVDEIEGGMFE